MAVLLWDSRRAWRHQLLEARRGVDIDRQAVEEHTNDVRTGYVQRERDGGCADPLCGYCVLRGCMVIDAVRVRHALPAVAS